MHWDFALILVFLAVAVPVLGRLRVRQILEAPRITKSQRLALYASTFVFQWLAAAVILWRCAVHGLPLESLGCAIPKPALTAAAAVVLTALLLANQIVSLKLIDSRPLSSQGLMPQLALKIFPQDASERLAFLVLAATVALCEEFIYRGFVQRLFQDLAGGFALAGVLASATMFGLAHLYQGRRGVFTTFIVGLIFSVVRVATGTLIPSIAAHLVADVAAAFLAPAKIRVALSREQSIAEVELFEHGE